jgi:dTDP-4-amino-4,6-dideoxygalactose transaminase
VSWPDWPQFDRRLERVLQEVGSTGRWTISGPSRGVESYEQRFARAFAAYTGTQYCVPTASGTTALIVALEALGVGFGDEVVVPGMTWVATASAVLSVNAVPVLVDVDPETLCIDPQALRAAITPRTKAIVVVHLYASMSDMDAVLEIANAHRIPVVEDCAQAHGAMWRGKRAGSIGTIGTFSMQESKLLTSGEGGAAVTDDRELARTMYLLKTDGRELQAPQPRGRMELRVTGQVTGSNYCMSEFEAALLLEQMPLLDEQNRVRGHNAVALAEALSGVPGVRALGTYPGVSLRTYYHYPIRFDPSAFGGNTSARIADLLSDELGFPFEPPDMPLDDSPYYRPFSRKRFTISPEHQAAINPARYSLPNAHLAYETTVLFHHAILLADATQMGSIVAAFDRVRRHCSGRP